MRAFALPAVCKKQQEDLTPWLKPPSSLRGQGEERALKIIQELFSVAVSIVSSCVRSLGRQIVRRGFRDSTEVRRIAAHRNVSFGSPLTLDFLSKPVI